MRALAITVILAVGGARAGDRDAISIAAGGDMIGPFHPLSVDDSSFATVASLFRDADVGFANQEGSIFDLASFPGFPAAETGGGYPLQPPAAAGAMRAMGLRLVSKANNHATDWGAEGLAQTLQSLAAAGIAEAGAGVSEAQARAPVYIETPHGVVALVDAASTFPPMAVAGPAVTRLGVTSHPRPGISALHIREVQLVSPRQFATLRALGGALSVNPDEVRIGDQVYRSSPHAGTVWEMEPRDEEAILAAIREARRHARVVIFSIHAHETGGDDDSGPAPWDPMILHRADEAPSPNDPRPAAFEPALFHAVIDAGADMVIRTGPHVTGGIEVYRERPIFYSLGSLFFDFGGRRSYTSPAGDTQTFPDVWFETFVPVITLGAGDCGEVRLYPLAIEPGGAASGVPHRVDPDTASRILQRVARDSEAFGTKTLLKDGVGRIGLCAAPAADQPAGQNNPARP
jgi:poly-gamma-glutamate synthesis protein (capsule biosynthesis protein)